MKPNRRMLHTALCTLLIALAIAIAPPVFAEETLDPVKDASGEYEYTVDAEGGATITGHNGNVVFITIPDSLDGHPVTGIEEYAFAFENQARVVIPDSVTSISAGAFENCLYLREFIVSENNPVYEATDGVLFDKTTKSLIAYPGGRLKSAYQIPEGTTAIEASAFYDNRSMTSVAVPDSVIKIGLRAFTSCDKLTAINVSETNPVYASVDGVLFDKTANALLAYPSGKKESSYEIPQGTTAIAGNAFSSCDHLNSILIPDEVTSIGCLAFAACENLSAIALPDSVTVIGENAFQFCEKLNSFTIPVGVTSIGAGAWTGCAALGAFEVSYENPKYAALDGVLFDKTTKTLIAYPGGKSAATYEIPTGTSAIGDYAFFFCKCVNNVAIPDGVTAIGKYAFSACSLSTVVFPDSVTSIGGAALSGCENLTAVAIPKGVKVIDGGTFSGCRSLTTVTIPEGVTEIRQGAFSDCPYLTEVTIPKGLRTIGERAFENCYNLYSVTLPLWMDFIADDAFDGCDALRPLTLLVYPFTYAESYGFDHNLKVMIRDPPKQTYSETSGVTMSRHF